MLFTRGKITNTRVVKINNVSIERTNFTKFLGVILDGKLKFAAHVNYVKNKISKCIGILCKAKKFLSISTLNYIIHSCIHIFHIALRYGVAHFILTLNHSSDCKRKQYGLYLVYQNLSVQ